VIAVWNYAAAEETGTPQTITIDQEGLRGKHRVSIYRLDEDHGNALAAYRPMGNPSSPSPDQYKILQAAGVSGPPQRVELRSSRIVLTLPAKALALVEFERIAGARRYGEL
jgi:xylan 1,4-beta-xylosidase